MQISASVLTGQTNLTATPDDAGAFDVPRGLVLALNGAAEAQSAIVAHLRETGQIQPGDEIDTAWPAP